MATPIEKSVSAAPVFSEDLSPLPLDRPPDPPPDPPPDGTPEPLATSGIVKASNSSVFTYEPFASPLDDPNTGLVPAQGSGHQNTKSDGIKVNENMKVLSCSNLSLKTNYKIIHDLVKKFGTVKRIKLKVSPNIQSFYCYITFELATSAWKAHASIKNGEIKELSNQPKLLDGRNLDDEDGDYVPKYLDPSNVNTVPRAMKIPFWHVASYKENQKNFVKAWDNLEDQIGSIPDGNLKNFGKKICSSKLPIDLKLCCCQTFLPTLTV